MWKALVLLICVMFVLPAIVAGVSKSEFEGKTANDIRIERVQEVRGGGHGGGHGGYHGGYRGPSGHGHYGHGYRSIGCFPAPIL